MFLQKTPSNGKLGNGVKEKHPDQQHWSQGKPHQDNGLLAFSSAVAAKANENQQKTQNDPTGTPAIPPYVPSLKYNPNAVGNRLGAFHGSKQPRKRKSAQVGDILVSAKQGVGEEAKEEQVRDSALQMAASNRHERYPW